MGLLNSLYRTFTANASGGYFLLFVDALILATTMVVTVFVRQSVYRSLSLGSDMVIAFLIGFTIVVCFNALVYVGSLKERPS